MATASESCFIKQLPDETVIFLKDTVNIRHCDHLQTLLLQAIECNKRLRIDMSELMDLDLSILQLLHATKKTADNQSLSFAIEPINEQSQSIIFSSHMLDELIN